MSPAITEERVTEMAHRALGGGEERAAIVKWLRAQHAGCGDPTCRTGRLLDSLAEAISNGAHKGYGS